MSICKDGAFTLNQHSIDTTTQQADYQLYDTSFYLKAVAKHEQKSRDGHLFFILTQNMESRDTSSYNGVLISAAANSLQYSF
jgi:hypothetical protein